MTVDDELILELIRPNRLGEVGDDALITKVVGTKNLAYKLEEMRIYVGVFEEKAETGLRRFHKDIEIIPDIFITLSKGEEIVIEIENDIHWDFQESLRQVKKYQRKFPDTRIVIPEDYKRFAPLYKNENVRVYLWKANRRWQCLKCGIETQKEGSVVPFCSNQKCNNHNQSDFRLVGLKDTRIEEFSEQAC
jgi:hypothetical protein